MNFSKYLCFFFTIFSFGFISAQDVKLWYQQPATKWTDALPIGNGRLGAMIFGTVEKEHLQFNEETLWTGGPRDHHREGAYESLAQIRQLLFEGKQAEAEKLATEKFMGLQSREGDRDRWVKSVQSLQGLKGNPALPDYDDSDWKMITVPSYEGWEIVGLEGVDGAVWFRTTFNVPNDWKDQELILDLNRIRDHDFTYINGQFVGTMNSNEPRKYIIPKNVLKAGANVVAIQVINYFDKGGLVGYKDTTRHVGIHRANATGDIISLNKQWKYKIQNDNPPPVPKYQADYQPFGDLWIEFNDHKQYSGYRRELDISNAISRVTYTASGVNFIREYFSSQPHNVIAIRLAADKKSSISFEASLTSPHRNFVTKKIDDHSVALSVKVHNGALYGESVLRVEHRGGKLTVNDNKVIAQNCDEIFIYLVAATNYVSYSNVTGDPVSACQKAIQALNGKQYSEIKSSHMQEYRRYFNTLSIELGTNSNQLTPTDKRIENFASRPDPSFAALYLQYGRYLLISSSRPGTRPANLQGIWNDLLSPPWGSKYTTNINAEMNYWPAEPLNLSPMHEPLFGMITDLAEVGQKTAKAHYNARGWVLHHNTDLWRGTAPINASNHGIWVTGGAWLSQHLWHRYEFTKDKIFLRDRAYPIMKSAALFFTDFLIKDPKTGWLISTPSNSPENGGLVAGPTMDHQIIRDLFKNCIIAGEVLGLDAEFRETLKNKYDSIAPNRIGKYGQLQEWMEDKDDTSNKHRHVSHLWGVHPGSEITWDKTPELMKAARQSLLYRGDAGTGWSLAWKINFWSRFKDGDHSFQMLKMLISPAATGGGSYVNLFDAHPPFQIDGNFGGAAGIGEMFVQSHSGYIELLPALPVSIPEGNIRGFCARGGFEIDMRWAKGQMQRVEILSKAGEHCVIKLRDKEVRFPTQKGKRYILDGQLKGG